MSGRCFEKVDVLEVRSDAFDEKAVSLRERFDIVAFAVGEGTRCVEADSEVLVNADLDDKRTEDAERLSTAFDDKVDVDTSEVALIDVDVDVELNPNPAAI